MISITDNRQSDNMKELKDLWPGDFFYFEEVLYRRVDFTRAYKIEPLDDDGIFVMLMDSGEVFTLHRDTKVEYISDKQIEIIIGD